MARRRLQQTFKLSEQVGSYDEDPVMPAEVDPQLTIGRADKPQPFFLICEKDSLVVQMTGAARIEFKDSSVRYVDTHAGDYIYVPARTPHRILPEEPGIIYRYKAAQAGLEATAWYCETCDGEVHRVTWDTASELPQEGYMRAVATFNADPASRRCGRCGAEHPLVDAEGNRWAEISAELRAGQGGEDDDDW